MKGPLEGFLAVPRGRTIGSVRFVNDAVDFIRKTSGQPHPYSYLFELMRKQGLAVYEDMGAAEISPVGDQEAIPDALRASVGVDRFQVVRFRVPAVHDRVFLHFTKLVITLDGGAQIAVREPDQGVLRESSITADDGAKLEAKCFVTAFDVRRTPIQKAGYEAQKRIFRAFNAYSRNFAIALGALSTIALGICACLVLTRAGWRSVDPGVLCVCAILVSLFVGRVAFYALVDSTIFPINLQRHLFAASILLFPVILIVGAVSAACIARNMTGKGKAHCV
jgi:hypothetical protein